MATGYLLQDFPNPNFGQFGWPRKKVSGVIGVHTTESGVIPFGPDGGAENTAAFIRRRTDPGGYHCLADADSRIKLVHPRYAAWADTTNNAHAMSVSGAMNAARWRDLTPARAAAITRNMGLAAAELAKDAVAAGLLAAVPPARRITPAEAIAGTRPGFYGHGETNPGRRYDPGQHFDWDLFLSTYATAVGGALNHNSTTTEEIDVITEEDRTAIAKATAEMVYGWVVKDGDHTANISWYLLSRKAATEELVRAVAQATAQTILGAELPNVMTGETTTLGTQISWLPEDFRRIRDGIEAGGGDALEGINADQIAALVKEGVDRATAGLSITLTADDAKPAGDK